MGVMAKSQQKQGRWRIFGGEHCTLTDSSPGCRSACHMQGLMLALILHSSRRTWRVDHASVRSGACRRVLIVNGSRRKIRRCRPYLHEIITRVRDRRNADRPVRRQNDAGTRMHHSAAVGHCSRLKGKSLFPYKVRHWWRSAVKNKRRNTTRS